MTLETGLRILKTILVRIKGIYFEVGIYLELLLGINGPYFEQVIEAWERRNDENFLFLFYEDTIKVSIMRNRMVTSITRLCFRINVRRFERYPIFLAKSCPKIKSRDWKITSALRNSRTINR